MQYKEYHQEILRLQEEVSRAYFAYRDTKTTIEKIIEVLDAKYLGDFAVGKPVKYKSSKYFVEAVTASSNTNVWVRIRKATKDGSRVNPVGKSIASVSISELEVWGNSI